jgi:GntR family transcriptional regulator
MVDIRIDFRSSQPIYMQIMEQIRSKIASGSLRPGDQLPTVRQLAKDLRVNFNTIARAYRQLDEAGLISTQHGRGTYVWETPLEESNLQLHNQDLQEMTEQFIRNLFAQGYSSAEIKAAIEKAIEH